MSTWTFHPFSPTQEAYEARQFDHASNVKRILQLFKNSSGLRIRGQLILHGTEADYPHNLGSVKFETEDMQSNKFLTIEYQSLAELEDYLKTLQWKESNIHRLVLYKTGFFIK